MMAATIIIVCLVLLLPGRQKQNTALTDREAAAISSICGADASAFTDISRDVLNKDISEKFPAVKKVCLYGGLFAFIVKPVGYNGPITLALVIDADNSVTVGLRVIEHSETPHYVRDMDRSWFIERFSGKSVSEYLTLVRLKAKEDREIVAITGATVTTEAVINGVNAAFGVYQQCVLGQTAEQVPYMVRFEPGKGDGPVETGRLAIRANGTVIAEISVEELRELPSVKRTMSIHSTGGATQHSFRGTLLSNVLNLADPELINGYQRVLTVGVDDYLSRIEMDEIRGENKVFLMYEDNDLPLQKKNGEPGAMRIIVIDDVFGQRFTNNLLEIVLESEETR